MKKRINYKFKEDKILTMIKLYIDETYTQHYAIIALYLEETNGRR